MMLELVNSYRWVFRPLLTSRGSLWRDIRDELHLHHGGRSQPGLDRAPDRSVFLVEELVPDEIQEAFSVVQIDQVHRRLYDVLERGSGLFEIFLELVHHPPDLL